MKPHRTTLLEDAASGSVRASVEAPVASSALRERLTQTRARIAQAHVAQPQIDVDWNPDELPTRVYQGQPLLSPRALSRRAVPAEPQANPLTAYALAQFRARVSQRPAPAPARPALPRKEAARELSLTQHATAQLPQIAHAEPSAEPPNHIAAQHERQTLPPFAGRVLREVSGVGARIGKLHPWLDHSDAALRRRVAYCSLALLVIAASSRMLFGGHSGARVILTLSPADAQVSLDASKLPGSAARRVIEGVAPGEHALSIERSGFVTQRHTLTLAPDEEEKQLSFKLTAVPRNANVAISSDPPGAQIFLDGRQSSQVTPAKLTDLPPGRHLIGLKLDGYADAKEALHVPGDALVSIKLASLNEPRFAPEKPGEATLTRAEQRAKARELARERRAAVRAAKVLLRYRARMGLPPDPVAQELVDSYGPAPSAE